MAEVIKFNRGVHSRIAAGAHEVQGLFVLPVEQGEVPVVEMDAGVLAEGAGPGEFLAEGSPDDIRANDEVRRVYLGQG